MVKHLLISTNQDEFSDTLFCTQTILGRLKISETRPSVLGHSGIFHPQFIPQDQYRR